MQYSKASLQKWSRRWNPTVSNTNNGLLNRDAKHCIRTTKEQPHWFLDLGTNVRVSVVFILQESLSRDSKLNDFEIVVGEFAPFKSKCCSCAALLV